MTDKILCDACGQGELLPESYVETFDYAGKSLAIPGVERYRCSHCNADPVFPDQIRRNHGRFAEAKRVADGFWKSEEIRAFRLACGLSQSDAAVIFGGGANAFSKYERGETIQSAPMDRLLRVAAAFPVIIDFLRAHVGLPIKQTDVPQFTEVTYTSSNDASIRSSSVFKGKQIFESQAVIDTNNVVSLRDHRTRNRAAA